MVLVDVIGRRRCLWLFMIGASIFTTPLLRSDAPDPGHASGDLDIIALFCTRMFAYGAFIVLFIYTPELYPTQIRSFAFGLYNALSRLGGLVSPFIAVDLFQQVRRRRCVVHSVRSGCMCCVGALYWHAAVNRSVTRCKSAGWSTGSRRHLLWSGYAGCYCGDVPPNGDHGDSPARGH